MASIASQAFRRCTPARFSCWCWQRLLPRFPDGGIRLNAHHVWQPELRESRAKLRALSITRIGQYHSYRNLLLQGLPNLLQSNFWLGLKLDLFRNARFSTALGILTPYFRQI